MQNLRNAMNKVPVTNATEEIARETIYFEFDRSDISAEANRQLRAFIAEMKSIRPVVTLYIEGHTDTSGAADYNTKLSQRRAQAVREALIVDGMTVGDYNELDMAADGESQPAVLTGDNVRERLNRRVEIIARGVKTDRTTVPATSQTSQLIIE
jgi:OOP family OmpA-OmpF porin